MSLSEIVVKVIGTILALVGLGLLLSAVGIHWFGVALAPIWLAILLGVCFLGAGIYIIRGGNVTL
jgi:hypothetical protein